MSASEQAGTGDNRPLRRLLPAVAGQLPPAVASQPPVQSSRRQISSRQIVLAACDTCRKRKAKCSGERPACGRCVKRGMHCQYSPKPGETSSQALKRDYDGLRGRAEAHKQILELLKNLPEEDAQDVLQRIRNGTDIVSILDQVKAGDLLLQLAVTPEARFRYEFPYRSEMPQDFLPNNPYLESLIYEAASLYPPGQVSASSSHHSTSGFAAAGNLRSAEYQSLYLKPFHAAQVIDPLLSDVKPSLWTSVSNNDALMRELLSVFFRCEYQFTSAFQKDYFLEDMASQRQDFCSSLLVNIVLGYSCVCYPHFSNRAEYWNPHTLQYRFLAEAKRLWELEATEPRITTVQAGILLNVFYNLCGLDEIGQAYRVQAIALAHELCLFGPSIDEQQNDRLRKGMAFTAWALYSWEALVGFSFMIRPLLHRPPNLPLPDPSDYLQWYGEIWTKYPLSQSLMPSFFGHMFRAKCQFRVIMNEFCHAAYSKGPGPAVTLDQANVIHSKLISWYKNLPGPLLAKNIVLPGHLQLHIYYHNLILCLYEPLLGIETNQQPPLEQTVAEANKHLQTLVRLYYLRHGFEAMDLFIVIPLMLAGFKCIDAIDEQSTTATLEVLRSTLMLITKGLCCQRRNHYLAEALFRVIRGRMRPQEAALLKETIDIDVEEANEKQVMKQAVRSHWPVSLVRKREDLDSHILKNLVDNYASLNVIDGSTVENEAQPSRGEDVMDRPTI